MDEIGFLNVTFVLILALYILIILIDMTAVKNREIYKKMLKTEEFRRFIGKEGPILISTFILLQMVCGFINLLIYKDLFLFSKALIFICAFLMVYLAIEKMGRYGLWR